MGKIIDDLWSTKFFVKMLKSVNYKCVEKFKNNKTNIHLESAF
jgi:hypothetical protein